jgi:hypothetical protein
MSESMVERVAKAIDDEPMRWLVGKHPNGEGSWLVTWDQTRPGEPISVESFPVMFSCATQAEANAWLLAELPKAQARAAIEAMREPTDAMLDHVKGQFDDHSGPFFEAAWNHMIDAALKD